MTIDKFREHLTEMRAIATDKDGREVLVGLSSEETEWYFAYSARRWRGDRRRGHSVDREKYLTLQTKHQLARFAILGAEVQKRTETPTSH